MKVHVIYDKNGTIVGGGLGGLAPSDRRAPRSGPQEGGGHHFGHFEIPNELSELAFHDLVDRIRVDVKTKEHRLVTR